MSSKKTQLRREQKIANESLRQQMKNEEMASYYEKYLKSSDSLLASYGNNTGNSKVSLAILHIAEELVMKMVRDASTVQKKTNRKEIEAADVHLASKSLYKRKDLDEIFEIKNLINSQHFPAIGNSSMHYAPLQRCFVNMDYNDRPLNDKKNELNDEEEDLTMA